MKLFLLDTLNVIVNRLSNLIPYKEFCEVFLYSSELQKKKISNVNKTRQKNHKV